MIDRQRTSIRFRSVRIFIPAVIRKRVSPKIIELCMETPCWCPSEGHQHGVICPKILSMIVVQVSFNFQASLYAAKITKNTMTELLYDSKRKTPQRI